jgi:LysR family positive regulator for ilvC
VADCAVRDQVLVEGRLRQGLDWSSVPLIVPERGVTKDQLDAWLAARGVRPRIYAQVAGHEAIVAMVGLGLGVGIAPQIVVDSGGLAGKVSQVDMADGLPPLEIGLCSLRQRLASPLLRSLWEVASSTYATAG